MSDERRDFYDSTLRVCNALRCCLSGKGAESVQSGGTVYIASFCDDHREEACKVFDQLRTEQLSIEHDYMLRLKGFRNRMNLMILSIGKKE